MVRIWNYNCATQLLGTCRRSSVVHVCRELLRNISGYSFPSFFNRDLVAFAPFFGQGCSLLPKLYLIVDRQFDLEYVDRKLVIYIYELDMFDFRPNF